MTGLEQLIAWGKENYNKHGDSIPTDVLGAKALELLAAEQKAACAAAVAVSNARPHTRVHKAVFTPVSPCTIKDDTSFPVGWYYIAKRFIRWDLRYWHRDVQYGIRNLYRWLPTIWRNRDWDNAYLNEIILKKLRYMQVECRMNIKEGRQHKALDRCVILMDELIKRDQCNCSLLGDKGPGGCDVTKTVVCYREQDDMRKEWARLWAKYSAAWWD